MDKQFILEILQYIATAFIGLGIWSLKGLARIVFENRDKIKDNFFQVDVAKEQIRENKNLIESHEKRLDKHDKAINTIVTTHNLTECAKSNKIELG